MLDAFVFLFVPAMIYGILMLVGCAGAAILLCALTICQIISLLLLCAIIYLLYRKNKKFAAKKR